jgi:hypothetical protein
MTRARTGLYVKTMGTPATISPRRGVPFRGNARAAYTVCEVPAMNKEQFGTIRGWMYVVGVAVIGVAFWFTHR